MFFSSVGGDFEWCWVSLEEKGQKDAEKLRNLKTSIHFILLNGGGHKVLLSIKKVKPLKIRGQANKWRDN